MERFDGACVEVLEWDFGPFFFRQRKDIHMTPEIVIPSILNSREDIEVLELCEGKEGGCYDNVYAK